MNQLLSALTPGATVRIKESGVYTNYIYLGVDLDNHPRLLRDKAVVNMALDTNSAPQYETSTADAWLNNLTDGFLARFSSEVWGLLADTTIYYYNYNSSASPGQQVLSSTKRRCFLLAYDEVGVNTGEGNRSYLNALKTYRNTTDADTARIAYSPTGEAVFTWLRSGASTTQFWSVHSSGHGYYSPATNSNYWLRPVLSVAANTRVSDDGAGHFNLVGALPLSLVGAAGGRKIDPNKRVQLWSGGPVKGTINLDLSKYQVIRVYCSSEDPSSYQYGDYYDIVVGMSTHTTREVGGYNCNTSISTNATGVYVSGGFPKYGGVSRVEAYY